MYIYTRTVVLSYGRTVVLSYCRIVVTGKDKQTPRPPNQLTFPLYLPSCSHTTLRSSVAAVRAAAVYSYIPSGNVYIPL